MSEQHMYVWSVLPSFIAIAQAPSVKEARELVLEQVGHGDGSCPERDKAAAWIQGNTPQIWHGRNAEFALTDSAELIEMTAWLEKKDATIRDQEKQLAQLTLERDQLREQCAYNQLTIEALTAKLAKVDRMDQ